MVGSVDKNRDQLQLLEEERAVKFDQIVDDIFCDERAGLHVFFQRSENNAHFIATLIQLHKLMDSQRVFNMSRDEDGFADPEQVIDELLKIFNVASEAVKSENDIVFVEANLSKEQFMASIQRGCIAIARMFEDSSFNAESYFLDNARSDFLVGYAGERPSNKTLPPPVLDIRSPSSSKRNPVNMPSIYERSSDGRIITVSFERENAIREMLKEMGVKMTVETFREEDSTAVMIKEVCRIVDNTLRTTSRQLIRKIPSSGLDRLIERSFDFVVQQLQDLSVDPRNKDKAIPHIIQFFFKPGNERLRARLEKKIKFEVEKYIREVHATPNTVIPSKTPTKRPSHGLGIPVAAPLQRVSVSKYEKTQRPPDFVPDPSLDGERSIEEIVDDSRASLVSPPVPNIDAPIVSDDSDIADEPTLVSPAPAQQPAASSPRQMVVVPPLGEPAPDNIVQPKEATRVLPPLHTEDEDETQTAPVKVASKVPTQRPPSPAEKTPLPQSTLRMFQDQPVINYRPQTPPEPTPAPVPAPTAGDSAQSQRECHPSLTRKARSKKTGIFSKSQKMGCRGHSCCSRGTRDLLGNTDAKYRQPRPILQRSAGDNGDG